MKSTILFLLHIPPPVHGSSLVGNFIEQSKLIGNDHECIYLNLLASKDLSDSGKASFSKILGFLSICFQIFRLLLFKKIEIVYFAVTSTGKAFYRDLIIVFILKLFNVKLLYHMHNKGVKNESKSLIKHNLYSFFFKNTKVILLSEKLYDDIKEFISRSNVFICPNGIPLVNINTGSYRTYQNKPVKILFLSNLISSKGVWVLLDACKILKREGVEFECNFVGGEADISSVELNQRINEFNLQGMVSYRGKKFDKDKYDIFLNSDIFAFPTFYEKECFPLVLLEAMQFKLPIISTAEGGIEDIVINNKNGFIINRNNPQQLAEKLRLLINDEKQRIKMGKMSFSTYEDKFTLNHFELCMNSIINNLL